MTWPVHSGQWPELRGADVHVWVASFDDWRAHAEALATLLAADERQRSDSFRPAERRSQSIITRGLLRRLLARYLGVNPEEVEFSYGKHGKPSLANPSAPMHFNMSHALGVVVFAVTRAGEVGVDVEHVRASMPRQIEIAEKFFARGEIERLRALGEPERVEAFFRCWTRKEAFLKARGDGVFGGLDTFEVSFDRDHARLMCVPGGDEGPWWMAALPDLAQHTGAVVVRAQECNLRCFGLDPKAFE